MTQREHIAEALRLATENPDAEIHVCAASDELLSEYAWTGHMISKVELGWWYVHNECIITDPAELAEELENEGFPPHETCNEVEAQAMMTRAILIYTRAG